MLAGPMDEIGFIVVDYRWGYIRLSPWWWWVHVMLAQRSSSRPEGGDIPGIIGSKPPQFLSDEERKKVLNLRILCGCWGPPRKR